MELVDQDAINQYITETFTDIEVLRPTDGPGAGDTFLYFDPMHNLDPKRQFPFATIVTKDYGDFDDASDLNRPDVFRLNIGVGWDAFRALFGPPPSEDSTKSTEYDFAALDRLMPHPAYASQSWVCAQPKSGDLRSSQALAGRSLLQRRLPARPRPDQSRLSSRRSIATGEWRRLLG